MLLGQNNKNLAKLVNIFVRIFQQPKVSAPELDVQLKAIMKALVQDDAIKQIIISLELDNIHKDILNRMAA